MRDSRNGSYATMGGCLWVVAKCAALARLGEMHGASRWAAGASGDALGDDEDAKGEYYNWFGK